MPFGNTQEDRRWFRGWYTMVIEPAVIECGFEPILAAAEEQPGAINDEIRAHLALDTMAVIDLGGFEADDPPNPNVMYELGIRHAFSLPLVIMAWEDQALPFDVSNQRAIMSQRDLLAVDVVRKKLVAFLIAAGEGKYYRPMEAVGRQATIDLASVSLGSDSILGALTQEVHALRETFTTFDARKLPPARRAKVHALKALIRKKNLRKPLYRAFENAGVSPSNWGKLLHIIPSDATKDEIPRWGIEDWIAYMSREAQELGILDPGVQVEVPELESESSVDQTTESKQGELLDSETLELIRKALPEQPWPKGTHRNIAADLGLSARHVSAAISHLISAGICFPQIDGVVYVPRAANAEEARESDT